MWDECIQFNWTESESLFNAYKTVDRISLGYKIIF